MPYVLGCPAEENVTKPEIHEQEKTKLNKMKQNKGETEHGETENIVDSVKAATADAIVALKCSELHGTKESRSDIDCCGVLEYLLTHLYQ